MYKEENMEKKSNDNPPCILVQYSSNFTVNSSLDETEQETKSVQTETDDVF